MEITKEQVLEIYNTNSFTYKRDMLEKWFPEAFKVELEVGKVYITTGESIIKCQSFGFDDIIGYGFSDTKGCLTDYVCKVKRKATTEEWESALIAEAKGRGYKNGNYECLYMPHLTEETDGKMFFEDGELWIGFGSKSNMLFKEGVWAEIIKTFSKEEAEKLIGGKII